MSDIGIGKHMMMWSSAYYFEITVYQILAELCHFENFHKLFAAYCLEVQILFLNRYMFVNN